MKRIGKAFLALALVASALSGGVVISGAQERTEAAARRASGKFYLKNGDRVVFYGDSITDQRLYTTFIETYCISRFPKSKFTFVHSGWGGDRVTGGGGGPIDVRLKRDVLVYKPTVVTICLGMNDGSYRAFDQKIFDTYINGYKHILDTLKKELPGVRITLLTAPAFDDVTRAPGFPGGYNATLLAYGEAVRALGEQYNLTVADTNIPLVAAMARANSAMPTTASQIIPDRVHPGPGGHLIMAAAVLKAWNAPDTVADIAVDATSKTTQSVNTTVSNLSVTPEKITYTQSDHALPWPIGRDPSHENARWAETVRQALAVTDIELSLNHYQLKVTGLNSARYVLRVDGQEIATLPREALEKGVDLAELSSLPANLQAQEVLNRTRKHNELHFQRWRVVQVPHAKNGLEVTADIQKQMDDLDAQEVDAIKQQRAAILPKSHTVELTPAA